jgi:hypothetical protein
VDGGALNLVWDLYAARDADPLTLRWDLAAARARELRLRWDLSAEVNADPLVLIWHLLRPTAEHAPWFVSPADFEAKGMEAGVDLSGPGRT